MSIKKLSFYKRLFFNGILLKNGVSCGNTKGALYFYRLSYSNAMNSNNYGLLKDKLCNTNEVKASGRFV